MDQHHQNTTRHVPDERTRLLSVSDQPQNRRLSRMIQDEASSIVDSHVSRQEKALSGSTVGERLPYNDYTTIDWLHDLVKDSYRYRMVHAGKGLRSKLIATFDRCSGWVAVAVVGTLTACVAFVVDVAEATVSDWKLGYCKRNPLLNREACCEDKTPLLGPTSKLGTDCRGFHEWSNNYWRTFAIYLAFALAFGAISSSATMLTKRALPAAAPGRGDKHSREDDSMDVEPVVAGKSLYMAAGSGIPEIKTILSGFVIPHFLDVKVLCVKGFGAIFAVATGMCLGKEGPFVHISACVGQLVLNWFPKYRDNGRKARELLAAAVASGLSVAFGAPIGGVLFSYEEISTYFPRKVLWRAFLCSLFAAMILRELNPTGTGKLVLFETNYGTSYKPQHYLVFVLLGVAGGVWGGMFCKLNFKWSKWFRTYPIIKNHPVFEVFLVVFATVLLQFPNPLTREPGDIIIRNLLVNCDTKTDGIAKSWVCQHEAQSGRNWEYIGWLVLGCTVKLVLTTITFGCKVPSGVIIPALDAGALFGRLVGQWITTISPGIFAMVGAAAFLAGVSRMTLSLCVIMFELTGELEYILPHMIAILVAKWVADSLSSEGVYDLAQNVLGHPFLDPDTSLSLVQAQSPAHLVRRLIPPKQTMNEITVHVDADNKVRRGVLETKLQRLKERGLMDAGVVLVQNGMLQGYLAEGELEFGLGELGKLYPAGVRVRVLGQKIEESDVMPDGFLDDVENARDDSLDKNASARVDETEADAELDLTSFVDRTPMAMCESAPMEYAVECFGKLGLRHLMITEEGTGKLIGVALKKRLIAYLQEIHEH